MNIIEEVKKLIKPKCVTCDKFYINKCCDCNFTKYSDPRTGIRFKYVNLYHIIKSHLFYLLYHPELNFKLPKLPEWDVLFNHLDDYNKWEWVIHHKDGNHFNDNGWNLQLLLRTEHSYIHAERIKYYWKGKFGSDHSLYGFKHSVETRQKISNKHTRKVVSEKTRKKMSESRKGIPISEDRRLKLIQYNYGRIVSTETRRKMSKSHKGHINNAKIYEVITPNNELIIIKCLKKFCNDNNINYGSMLKYKKTKGYSCRKIN